MLYILTENGTEILVSLQLLIFYKDILFKNTRIIKIICFYIIEYIINKWYMIYLIQSQFYNVNL